MTFAAMLASDGPLQLGVPDGPDVRALQIALSNAGYRIDITTGTFTADTDYWVRQFQKQHNFTVNGILDKDEAALLDIPHDEVLAAATPLIHAASGLPHDDTASLIAFYGNPDAPGFEDNIVRVTPPFPLTYAGNPWPHSIEFHRKCAPAFEQAFSLIWEAAGHDLASPILRRVSKFSGSRVNRPIRGSSRKSCHAFAAALDVDADELPMGCGVDPAIMPIEIVNSFDAAGLFWGNNYIGRKDPMDWQGAHE